MSNFITEIKIEKVRHLENINIVLGDKKKNLILTGKNGSGKTSVLEELDKYIFMVLTTDASFGAVDTFWTSAEARKKKIEEVVGIAILLNKYDLFEIARDSRMNNNQPYNFIYSFFSAKRVNKTDNPQGINKIDFSKNKTDKLNQKFLQYIVNLKAERSFARDDNDMESVKKIDDWFYKFENMLKQIFGDNDLNIEFDRKNYNFTIHRKNREPFDFNGLSAGYSAIIDIVTELILKIENTKSKSFDCEGIVFIDEIENHLHVELQKNILPLLTSFFPNIQFIVTTHSPFVLSSIENSVVYDLETHIRTENLSEASYTGLIRKYFELPSEYSTVLENKFKEFKILAKKESMTEVEEDRLIELDVEFKNISPLFSPEIYSSYLEIRKEFLH